jgi:hypothetical protein
MKFDDFTAASILEHNTATPCLYLQGKDALYAEHEGNEFLRHVFRYLPNTRCQTLKDRNTGGQAFRCLQLRHPTTFLKFLLIPYFSIDNEHLVYNAHPKLFDIPFDVQITRMTLTSGRVRKYGPLLTEDTGVIPKKVPG